MFQRMRLGVTVRQFVPPLLRNNAFINISSQASESVFLPPKMAWVACNSANPGARKIRHDGSKMAPKWSLRAMHGPLTMCKACPACKFYCDQDTTKGGRGDFWTSQRPASALSLAWGNSRVRIDVACVSISLTLSLEHFLGAEVRR